MKDREKQIEEMAKVIGDTWLVNLVGETKDVCEVLDEVDIEGIARELYEQDYRKADEVRKETAREILKRGKYCMPSGLRDWIKEHYSLEEGE